MIPFIEIGQSALLISLFCRPSNLTALVLIHLLMKKRTQGATHHHNLWKKDFKRKPEEEGQTLHHFSCDIYSRSRLRKEHGSGRDAQFNESGALAYQQKKITQYILSTKKKIIITTNIICGPDFFELFTIICFYVYSMCASNS